MDEYYNFLIQIPLVLAFMIFTLKMLEMFDKNLKERDRSWQEFLDKLNDRNNRFIAEQSNHFFSNLGDLRRTFEIAIDRLSCEHEELRRKIDEFMTRIK